MEKWANKLTVQNLKWNVSKQVYPVCYSCCLGITRVVWVLPRVVCFGSEDQGEWNGSNAGEGLSAQRVSITCT